MAMMDDISEINRKVLNKSVNQGVVFAKRNTPVGEMCIRDRSSRAWINRQN